MSQVGLKMSQVCLKMSQITLKQGLYLKTIT